MNPLQVYQRDMIFYKLQTGSNPQVGDYYKMEYTNGDVCYGKILNIEKYDGECYYCTAEIIRSGAANAQLHHFSLDTFSNGNLYVRPAKIVY